MEEISTSQLIGAMYLEIIHGDVHIKNQYMNTFLSKIALFIRRNQLEPNMNNIVKFRTSLHNTINMILHNNFPMPAYHELREKEIANYMEYFKTFMIKIDDQVADSKGVREIGILEDIETMEYCMNICYSATQDYAVSLSSSAPGGEQQSNVQGLASAMNKFAYILNLVEPIIDRYKIAQFDTKSYDQAAKLASMRLQGEREKGARS